MPLRLKTYRSSRDDFSKMSYKRTALFYYRARNILSNFGTYTSQLSLFFVIFSFVCLFVCLLGNLFSIPEKSNSFLRWLRSLAAYSRNTRKRDSYHHAISSYRCFCASMSLELPTDSYVTKLDSRAVIPLPPWDQHS